MKAQRGYLTRIPQQRRKEAGRVHGVVWRQGSDPFRVAQPLHAWLFRDKGEQRGGEEEAAEGCGCGWVLPSPSVAVGLGRI